MPVLNLTDTPLGGAGATWKAIEDYLLGLAIMVVVAPVMLLIALGVKVTSRGPVLYRQERVTWNGRRFVMLKFRTMPIDAEVDTGPVWMRRGERRATGLGAILRRFSLDELPQLINVLRGEMSLVGPRPERPDAEEMNLPVLYAMVGLLILAVLFPAWETPPGQSPEFLGFHFMLSPPEPPTRFIANFATRLGLALEMILTFWFWKPSPA